MSFLARAQPLIERGLPVMPLRAGGKEAMISGWPEKATSDLATIEKWAEHAPDANVGVVARKGGFWMLDIDDLAVLAQIREKTGQALEGCTYTVKTAKGLHFYFTQTPLIEGIGNVTVRGDNGSELYSARVLDRYVVGAGSKHPSGALYEVAVNRPIEAAPLWLIHWIKEQNGRATYPISESQGTAIRDGGRNNALTSLAGAMRRRGATESSILAALLEQNTRTCVPPLSEREVEIVAHSVSRYAPEGQIEPVQERQRLVVPPLGEFLAAELPQAAPLMGAILRSKNIMEIYAWRGVGKTYFAIGLGLAVASGSRFLKWDAPAPKRVLYLDGEMAGHEFQERLRNLRATHPGGVDSNFFPMCFDTTEGNTPNLSNPSGRTIIDGLIAQVQAELIIIDNLSCFAPIAEVDNEAGEWSPVQEWFLSLRRRGITTIFIHHAGKGGAQRGTSRREDICNTVIKLEHPRNYRPEEGLRAKLKFEKTRGFSGPDAEELEIELQQGPQGMIWTYRQGHTADLERILELAETGMTDAEIAAELSINRTTVWRARRQQARNAMAAGV